MGTTKSNVEIVISAQDKASGVLKKTESSVSRLTGVVKGLAIGAGALYAGKKLVDFASSSVDAFREAEVSAVKVSTILKTLGKVGEEAAGKIDELSQASIQLGFDDEATAESLARLLQVTGDMTKAQESNTLAMDIARGKGIELADATRIVTLLHAGSTRELKALGIEVDENATKTENLRAVQERYAGQASAFAQTSAGQAEIMAQSFENIQEKIGGALNTALKPFYAKLLEVLSRKDVQEFITKLADNIGRVLAGALTWAANNSDKLRGAWNVLASATNFIIGVFKLLQKALEAVFYAMFRAIDIARDKWNQLKASVQSAVNSITGAWNSLRSALSKPISGIVNIAQKISGKLSGKKDLGGPVMKGGAYLVGEHRPEVFVPNQSGNIKQMGGGMGGEMTINFVNPIVRSEADLDSIIRAVKDAIAYDQKKASFGIRTV